MAIGAALVVTSLGLGALVVMGAFGRRRNRRAQDVVVARPATPTPVPTLPPIVSQDARSARRPNAEHPRLHPNDRDCQRPSYRQLAR
jgi:hypothetical protein